MNNSPNPQQNPNQIFIKIGFPADKIVISPRKSGVMGSSFFWKLSGCFRGAYVARRRPSAAAQYMPRKNKPISFKKKL